MRYFFADLVPSEAGGFEPRLPDNHGFLLLADSGIGSAWGIFHVSLVDHGASCEGFVPLADELQALISCAEGYAPALAIARDETATAFAGRKTSRAEFAEYYGDSIRRQLKAQDTSRFLMAKAVHDEVGYLTRGSYYWIVDYFHERRQVAWVSLDFHLYRNPAAHFDVPRYRLVSLARWRIDSSQAALYGDAVPPLEHAGEVRVELLQREINRIVEEAGAPISMRLDQGSEGIDLTRNADVRAEWEGYRSRLFRVVSQEAIGAFLGQSAPIGPTDIYAVGCPLIIVKEINANTIVRGVLRHVQLEGC